MQEWHARLPTSNIFFKFRVYIQNEYTKQVKWNRSTAGSVGKGIANAMTEERISDVKAQAMVIAKVANALHIQNAEHMKNMMMMFKEILTSVQPPTVPAAGTKPPRQPRQPKTKCPNCKKKHANHGKFWELKTNKARRPAKWKATQSA